MPANSLLSSVSIINVCKTIFIFSVPSNNLRPPQLRSCLEIPREKLGRGQQRFRLQELPGSYGAYGAYVETGLEGFPAMRGFRNKGSCNKKKQGPAPSSSTLRTAVGFHLLPSFSQNPMEYDFSFPLSSGEKQESGAQPQAMSIKHRG